jgi:hypothetical protein
MKAKKDGNSDKNLVSQADFARLRGISRAAVTDMKKGGYLVFHGDLVDVAASTAKLNERPAAMRQAVEEEASAAAERWLRESGAIRSSRPDGCGRTTPHKKPRSSWSC